ncbi:MFS transporter, partial [Streptomyces sp. TRM76130]|nr:MFS transporter [Streptomyces sp. TRM76130]
TASSLMETGTEFGGALSMAVFGSIGTAVYHREMPGSAPDAARETLGGALAVTGRLPGSAGEALATAAREAFTSGMRGAAVAGAVLLLAAAYPAARALRGIRVRENAGEAARLDLSGV